MQIARIADVRFAARPRTQIGINRPGEFHARLNHQVMARRRSLSVPGSTEPVTAC